MSQSNLSTRTIDLVANRPLPLALDGEFFVVDSASGTFEMRVEGGEWIPGRVKVRQRFNNPDRFSRVTFRATGAITLTIIHGVGDYQDQSQEVSGTVSVNEPAAAVVTAGCEVLTGAETYEDKRSVSIFNAGGSTIEVNGETIAAGLFLAWRVDRQNERLSDIVVDATGSSALVTWTE